MPEAQGQQQPSGAEPAQANVVPSNAQTQPPEIDWKAEARKWEERAKENTEARKRLDEIEAASKSELEKAQEAATSATATATKAQQEALRLRVAIAKGLPASLVDRLRGADEQEIAADADELLKLVAPAGGPQPAGPRPDLAQGARGTTVATGDPGKEFEVFINKQLSNR